MVDMENKITLLLYLENELMPELYSELKIIDKITVKLRKEIGDIIIPSDEKDEKVYDVKYLGGILRVHKVFEFGVQPYSFRWKKRPSGYHKKMMQMQVDNE